MYCELIKVLVFLLTPRMTWDPNFKGKLLLCCFFSSSVFYFLPHTSPLPPKKLFPVSSEISSLQDSMKGHLLIKSAYSYNFTQIRSFWIWDNVPRYTCLFKHMAHLVINTICGSKSLFFYINLCKNFMYNLWLRIKSIVIWTWEYPFKMY